MLLPISKIASSRLRIPCLLSIGLLGIGLLGIDGHTLSLFSMYFKFSLLLGPGGGDLFLAYRLYM